MLCGAGSFSHVDEDPSAPSTPRGGSSRRKQGGNNPYSTRGLDKFSTVRAELEAKREKIMERAGSQGVSVVQFVYSNSRDWVPIVVRPRDPPPDEKTKKAAAAAGGVDGPNKKSEVVEEPPTTGNDSARAGSVSDRTVKKSFSWNLKEGEGWMRPSYYWPMVVVLILLCLVMFGRAFAICCTSIWWYLVPTMKGESRNVRKYSVKKKKDHGRRVSDKKLGGGDAVASPRHLTNVKRR